MFVITVRLIVFIVCLGFSFSLQAAQSKTSIWKEHIEFARGAVQQNDFTEAEANYALAFAEAEQTFKGTDLRYLETGYEAARLYIQLRKYSKAIAVVNQVLVRMEKHKEGEQYAKARFLNLLGDAYLFANRLDESENAYQRGFDLFKGKIDERNVYAAESLKGLAAVAVSRNRSQEGLELYQKALGIAKDTGMSRFRRNYDPRPAASLQSGIENEIGILHMTATNYVEARKWFGSAQETIEKNFGKTPRSSNRY